MIKKKIYEYYALLFSKPYFIKFNKFLYNLSLRGLGILNYRTEELSGERDWLKKYIGKKIDPLVVDVGANVGKYSSLVLDINKNARVVAIEAHPINYKKLKINLKPFEDRVKLLNYAIDSEENVMELFDYVDKESSSHASLYKEVITDIHKSDCKVYKVKSTTLDKIFANEDRTIDLLKIDTEGNEYKVLLGARNLLENNKIKAIQFEFNEMNIISKSSFFDFWKLLHEKYKFNFYRLLPYGRLFPIEKYSTMYCEIYLYQNIVCLKTD